MPASISGSVWRTAFETAPVVGSVPSAVTTGPIAGGTLTPWAIRPSNTVAAPSPAGLPLAVTLLATVMTAGAGAGPGAGGAGTAAATMPRSTALPFFVAVKLNSALLSVGW